jgi:hypothetical protein
MQSEKNPWYIETTELAEMLFQEAGENLARESAESFMETFESCSESTGFRSRRVSRHHFSSTPERSG